MDGNNLKDYDSIKGKIGKYPGLILYHNVITNAIPKDWLEQIQQSRNIANDIREAKENISKIEEEIKAFIRLSNKDFTTIQAFLCAGRISGKENLVSISVKDTIQHRSVQKKVGSEFDILN